MQDTTEFYQDGLSVRNDFRVGTWSRGGLFMSTRPEVYHMVMKCEIISNILEKKQARSQVCVAGLATLPWRNHVVQNLRAHFILHVVTIK